MKRLTLRTLAGILLLLVIVAPASAAPPASADGRFTANVDFSTLITTSVGADCLLEVQGMLGFSGSLVGTAAGTTRALVFASCQDVLANPPGTFRDVFKAVLAFTGTVNGMSVTADITYQGKTMVGGAIDGKMRLSNGLHGVLDVDAIVVVGGSYTGFIQTD